MCNSYLSTKHRVRRDKNLGATESYRWILFCVYTYYLFLFQHLCWPKSLAQKLTLFYSNLTKYRHTKNAYRHHMIETVIETKKLGSSSYSSFTIRKPLRKTFDVSMNCLFNRNFLIYLFASCENLMKIKGVANRSFLLLF